MRILLCPSAYHPSLGGVEEIARNLGKTLKANGHTVAIAVNLHPKSLPIHETLEEIEVYRFPFDYPNRSISGCLELLKMPLNLLTFIDFLKKFDPQIVHVICPSSNSLYCYAAKLLLGKKTLVTLQGEFFMDANDIYGRSPFARFGAQKLLSIADAVTACSDYVMSDAKRRFTFEPKIERIVFNGVDLDEQPTEITGEKLPTKFILAVGRLVQNKGFDDLILSLKELKEEYSDVHLVIAGAGPALVELEALTTRHQLSERVHFVGRQNRGSITNLFNKCMFFVLPSHVEPFGIVCIESMRAGKPVVAANTGGPPEFINNELNGLLYAPRNVNSLAAALNRLCEDETLRIRLGVNALNIVPSFDWTVITRQYEKLYAEMAGER